MATIKNWFLRNFWNGYNTFEKLFLAFMVALQIVVFIVCPDSPLNIIAGLAGVVSVVMCAKGRTMFYFIGFIQTVTYLVLAWQNNFYGEVLENMFYFVTMIWGIFVWKKNEVTNEDGTKDVLAKKFTPVQWILSIIGTIIATVAMGYWLNSIGSAQAYTDAATNVMAIFAQILMVRRYREQWIWWIVIDLFCIKMWFVAGNWSMVAMYIAWTANCIYGWYNWSKLNKDQNTLKFVVDYSNTNGQDEVAPEQLQIGEDVVGTVNEELRWKIWMTHYNEDGEVIGYGVYPTDYAHKSSATRRARQLMETDSLRTCIVSQTNPWAVCEEETYDEGGYGYVKGE